MKSEVCACIKCKTEFEPKEGQICPLCGGEIRPIKNEEIDKSVTEKKPRARK